jgi:2'-5' RNA ligase
VRLFTALWVPPAAAAALRAVTGSAAVPPGWRAVHPETWHMTLAFHGEAEPEQLAPALYTAAFGAPAPRLRLSGAGTFRGVHWVGVQAEPAERLQALVVAAGGDPVDFVPHVTLLRRRGRGREPGPVQPPWADHHGPWWRPANVLLVRSEPGRGRPGQGGSHYRVVHRVPLGPS